MAKLNEKIARKARLACEKWRAHFKQNIDLYHLMHNFVLGSQWDQDEEDDMMKTYLILCSVSSSKIPRSCKWFP
jgi:hypothetical protein